MLRCSFFSAVYSCLESLLILAASCAFLFAATIVIMAFCRMKLFYVQFADMRKLDMETFGETFGRNHFRHRGKGSGGGGGNQGGGKGGGGGRNRNNRRRGGGGKGGGGGGYGGGAAAVKDSRIDNLSQEHDKVCRL